MSHQKPAASPPSAGQSPLADFTLSLAQALVRHGYFAPDHPEVERSFAGLHHDFSRAVGEGPGLTYLVGRAGDDETVMLQAPGERPQAFDDLLAPGAAELFAPRILDIFQRRHLLSFTLRPRIGAKELRGFVNLLSESPQDDGAPDERERVESALLDMHILDASTVFESDIVGRERELHWRVALALSRLGRDLRTLPVFERESAEEAQRVKAQALGDLVRSLEAPELVRDVLLNCDLLEDDPQARESARLEQEVIAQAPPARLRDTCRLIIDETVAAPGDPLGPRRRLVLRHVLIGLLQQGLDVDADVLEACVAVGAATFDELPKDVRGNLKRRRAVDTFLVRRDEYLEALSHVPAGEKGVQLAKTGETFFAELVNRECWIEAAQVLHALSTGSHEGEGAPAVREAIDRSRAVVSEVKVLGPVLYALSKESTERPLAVALVSLAALAGRPAAKALRDLYRESDSRSVRAHVFEAIKGVGAAALVPFLNELTEVEPEWSGIHHVLAALAGSDDPSLAEPVGLFLKHENAHVRQAALARTFELLGPGAEEKLIEALADVDATVRHAAVAHLGSLASSHPAAMAFLIGVLSPLLEGAPTETSDEILLEVCRSLVSTAQAAPDEAPKIEETLLNALTLSDEGKLLGRLRSPNAHFSQPVRIALCEALASIGTDWSLTVLGEMAEGEGPVAEACLEAATRIRGRA